MGKEVALQLALTNVYLLCYNIFVSKDDIGAV